MKGDRSKAERKLSQDSAAKPIAERKLGAAQLPSYPDNRSLSAVPDCRPDKSRFASKESSIQSSYLTKHESRFPRHREPTPAEMASRR